MTQRTAETTIAWRIWDILFTFLQTIAWSGVEAHVVAAGRALRAPSPRGGGAGGAVPAATGAGACGVPVPVPAPVPLFRFRREGPTPLGPAAEAEAVVGKGPPREGLPKGGQRGLASNLRLMPEVPERLDHLPGAKRALWPQMARSGIGS